MYHMSYILYINQLACDTLNYEHYWIISCVQGKRKFENSNCYQPIYKKLLSKNPCLIYPYADRKHIFGKTSPLGTI